MFATAKLSVDLITKFALMMAILLTAILRDTQLLLFFFLLHNLNCVQQHYHYPHLVFMNELLFKIKIE